MLSFPEKIIFTIALIASLASAWVLGRRIVRTIGRGQGKTDWSVVPGRIADVLVKFVALPTVWRTRFVASLFHAFVAWGFTFYVLVNFGDILEAYIPGFHFLGQGSLANIYNLAADLLSVAVLVGMVALMVRRFILRDPQLHTRETTLLHPKAVQGKQRDSLIVGVFILLHVGFRFLGESFQVAIRSQIPGSPSLHAGLASVEWVNSFWVWSSGNTYLFLDRSGSDPGIYSIFFHI